MADKAAYDCYWLAAFAHIYNQERLLNYLIISGVQKKSRRRPNYTPPPENTRAAAAGGGLYLVANNHSSAS